MVKLEQLEKMHGKWCTGIVWSSVSASSHVAMRQLLVVSLQFYTVANLSSHAVDEHCQCSNGQLFLLQNKIQI